MVVHGSPMMPEGPMGGVGGYSSPVQLGKLQAFNGGCQPSHKGRNKKRKPKEEPMDTGISECCKYFTPLEYINYLYK